MAIEDSVVHVEVFKRSPITEGLITMFQGVPQPFGPVRKTLGSGVVWRAGGLIITNSHVVQDAVAITVRTSDGGEYSAKLLGRDPATDIALIKVDANLPVAPWGDSGKAAVGSRVRVMGSPFGFSRSVSAGVLSAKGRSGIGINTLEDFLQTDASINPGNSGGALVDDGGYVIGINSLIISRGQGVGFAIASNLADWSARHLLDSGEARRPWIGIGMQTATPSLAQAFGAPGFGVLVNQVLANGPAAGILAVGDIITTVGGVQVVDTQELVRELLKFGPGQAASLVIFRNKGSVTVSVPVSWQTSKTSRDPIQDIDPSKTPIGLGLKTHELGSVVSELDPESIADRAAMMVGDVIAEVNRIASPAPKTVFDAVSAGGALVLVHRGAGAFYTLIRRG